ncbi:MAG: hypothetical protein OEW12_09925, partial [Deltaproteobacteria bacterium]|nr:hypothetical protein [Deltaproteobacteria bacterium]
MAKKQKSIQKPSAGEKPGLLPSSRVLLSGAGLAGLSGILMGLAFPGRGLDWLGLVALAPLFAGLARLMDGGLSRRGRWGAALAGCWLAGLAASMWMGGWVVNTAHVYGGLSPVVAAAAGVLGYGTLTGLDLFLFVGAPFVAAWGRPRLLLLMVPFWAAAFQAWTPRFFYWSYGQLMYGADWLVQGVDLVGSSGLNLVYLPLQLVLAGGLLAGLKTPVVPLGELKKGGVVVLVLLGLAGGYGGLRLGQLQALDDEGADSAGSELVANPPA